MYFRAFSVVLVLVFVSSYSHATGFRLAKRRVKNPSFPKAFESVASKVGLMRRQVDARFENICTVTNYLGCFVTAGHCFEPEYSTVPTSAVRVWVGKDIDNRWVRGRDVATITVHPGFKGDEETSPYDFAIVRPTQLVPESISFGLETLATILPKLKERIVIGGYGQGPEDERKLRSGEVEALDGVSFLELAPLFGGFGVAALDLSVKHIVATTFQTEDGKPLSSLAGGDSGGPAFIFRDGKPIQVGVNHAIRPLKEKSGNDVLDNANEKTGSIYNFFTSVANHRAWILETLEKEGCGDWKNDPLTQVALELSAGKVPVKGSWEDKVTDEERASVQKLENFAKKALALTDRVAIDLVGVQSDGKKLLGMRVFQAAADGRTAQQVALLFVEPEGFIRTIRY